MQTDRLYHTLEQAVKYQAGGTIVRINETWEDQSLVLFRAYGEQAGPTIWIQAAVHGDEHDGVIACMRLMSDLCLDKLHGSLVIFPIANASALLAGTNGSPIDGVNLNRVFTERIGTDKHIANSYSYRYGRWLAEKIKTHADVLIDLHGGGQWLEVCPFAMVASDDGAAYATAIEALEPVPLTAIYSCSSSGKGMLINEICRAGIPSILLESGGGSSWGEGGVQTHLEGVRILLDRFKSYPVAYSDFSASQRHHKNRILSISEVVELRFETDGLRTLRREAGEIVRKGDRLINVLTYPALAEESLRCPIEQGVILSIHTASSVRSGGYAVMLGKLT
ncbi:succinylglutamate desuccinylase/aspartoacylase domain-containing protein [Saccharibacillus sacchari]|uniref:Succinylglutamate desuccinylase/aspartoacylase family protein n=1 Tax=Saccharibacillus sacchari TaxID=456493 RepID=A0ACC6PE03_9BACL